VTRAPAAAAAAADDDDDDVTVTSPTAAAAMTSLCVRVTAQVMIRRLPEPYDECVDTTSGEHDFRRNVYEEHYPETLYSLEVIRAESLQ